MPSTFHAKAKLQDSAPKGPLSNITGLHVQVNPKYAKVKDSALLNKLTEGKRVDVEFVQEGKDYVPG